MLFFNKVPIQKCKTLNSYVSVQKYSILTFLNVHTSIFSVRSVLFNVFSKYGLENDDSKFYDSYLMKCLYNTLS